MDTSFALRISPPNRCINCHYPDTCQERLELTCHSDAETQWLDKNSRLITTTDNRVGIHSKTNGHTCFCIGTHTCLLLFMSIICCLVEGTTLVFLSRQRTDEGNYTCRNVHNQTIKASVQILVRGDHRDASNTIITIVVIDDSNPHFTYSCNPNSRYLSDQQTALLYHDNFINCSFEPISSFSGATYWDYKGRLLYTTDNSKYSQNTSGLIIHNFTETDLGTYKCLIGNGDPLIATINVLLGCKLLSI